MTKHYRVTISGSFKATDNQIESFDKVVGITPALDEDKLSQMIIKRYARIWIGQETIGDEGELKYKRVQRVREVFIDSIEEADDLEGKSLSYVGKNIMDMNFEELQDLAAAKDLIAIPLYKTSSLTHARRIAFAEYASKVLGITETNAKGQEINIDWRSAGYNPSNYAAIKADASIRRDGDAPVSIEESIDREALILDKKATPTEARLTLAQLKAIAESKKITYHSTIGYQALYDKIYGKTVAA